MSDAPSAGPELRLDPDWLGAAQLLVDGCAYLPGTQARVQLLERLCVALGPALYPALIGVLCTIGDQGSDAAMAAVADTLVEALRTGRLPGGRRAAWGVASANWAQAKGTRSLGPVEYLCAWQAEPATLAASAMSDIEFDRALRALLVLVSQNDMARALYCERLRAVADDPLEGTLSRGTRAAIRQLAASWETCGADFQLPVDAFVEAARGRLSSTGWRPR
jgi:hypothetical protein